MVYKRSMALVKTLEEIKMMREAGKRLALIVKELADRVVPGVTTLELEQYAQKRIVDVGASSAFLGYKTSPDGVPFPGSLCVSINQEIVHAPTTPSRTINDGDVVSIDFGLIYPAVSGYYADMAVTRIAGTATAEKQRLVDCTKFALEEGIKQVRPLAHVQDISKEVERFVTNSGFGVIRDFVGHGIGRRLHEPPQIPNYADRRFPNPPLVPGMCLAIEPMVVAGEPQVRVLNDGWTVVTRDKSLAAHFEHTVLVTEDGYEILTTV